MIAVGIEEKFDLLLANYAEHEKELLDLTLNYMLYRAVEWQGLRADNLRVIRRLANLLSAARPYVDQLRHDLSQVYGAESESAATVRSAMASEYDHGWGIV